MTPWTALLESLHSAWIDEVNARVPKARPELGLPVRFAGWGIPEKALAELDFYGVSIYFDDSQPSGWIVLGGSPAFFMELKLDLPAFSRSVFGRAAGDFQRRGIKPKIQAEKEFETAQSMQQDLGPVSRMIWIPLVLKDHLGFLALAI